MQIKLNKIERQDHPISRGSFSRPALKVLYQLKDSGYDGYLVGGCLRDLLRGKTPKDFDVVTNATPEQVAKIFPNCRLIGRRFRLAHIHFGREIIEVATFRSADKGVANEDGMILKQNHYGDIESDVLRRDLTMNALYYNIKDFALYDYVGAFSDIEEGIIRIIGDADERYQEDPVRMLRVIRFAAKLDMRIDPETELAIGRQKHLIANVATARLFDELLKIFFSGHALRSFEELRSYDLFSELFRETDLILNNHENEGMIFQRNLIKKALINTDYRLKHNESVNPGFLLAVLLWPVYQTIYNAKISKGVHWHTALQDSIEYVFYQTNQRLGVPMRHKSTMRDIWTMQLRLESPPNKRRIEMTMSNKRFRASYDFLELRFKTGEDSLAEAYDFWTKAQLDNNSIDVVTEELLPRAKYRNRMRRRK